MLNTSQSHSALGFEQPPGVRHAFLSRGFERLRVAPPWPRLLCPSAPLHWLSGLLLPSARLLNCNRLSFTQAPPFEPESHAPPQGHIPHPPPPPPLQPPLCDRVPPPAELPFHIGFNSPLTPPPRPVSSHHWRAPASGPAPCPDPWLPLSPQMPPGPATVLGLLSFGGTLFLFSSRRPAAEKGILKSSVDSSFLLRTYFAPSQGGEQLCPRCVLSCFCCSLCVPALVRDLGVRQRSSGVVQRLGRCWEPGDIA